MSNVTCDMSLKSNHRAAHIHRKLH